MTEKTVPATKQESASKVTTPTAVLTPRVDIVEDDTGITLWADVPGVPKDKLELRVENDTLSIEGEVALSLPEGLEPLYAEVRAARYARQFTLSRELDANGIEARLEAGVLTLRIPKHRHAQPRRIAVQVA